jgi:hypothetical protein
MLLHMLRKRIVLDRPCMVLASATGTRKFDELPKDNWHLHALLAQTGWKHRCAWRRTELVQSSQTSKLYFYSVLSLLLLSTAVTAIAVVVPQLLVLLS